MSPYSRHPASAVRHRGSALANTSERRRCVLLVARYKPAKGRDKPMGTWERLLRLVPRDKGLDEHGQPENRLFNHKRLVERAVDELIGMSKMVVADGKVDQQEADFLLQWMEKNK